MKYVQMNSNAETYVAHLLGMDNVAEPLEPENVVEAYLEFVLSTGGIIQKPALTEVVKDLDTLYTLENPMKGVIYLVPNGTDRVNNLYDEYQYVNGEFELMGSVNINVNIINDRNPANDSVYSSNKTLLVVDEAKQELQDIIDTLNERIDALESCDGSGHGDNSGSGEVVLPDDVMEEINDLKRAVEGFTIELSNIDTSIIEINANVGDLEGQVTTLSGEVKDFNTLVNANNGEISLMNGKLDNMKIDIDNNKSEVTIAKNLVGDLSTSVEGVVTEVERLSDVFVDMTDITDNMNTLTGVVDKLTTDMESVTDFATDIEGINTSITTLTGEVQGVTSEVTTLSGSIGTLETSNTNLSNSVDTLTTTVSGYDTSITNVQDSVDTLTTEVSDITDRLDVIDQTVSTNSTLITIVSDASLVTTNKVTDLTTEVEGFNGRITTIKGDIVDLNDKYEEVFQSGVSIKNDIVDVINSKGIVGINVDSSWDEIVDSLNLIAGGSSGSGSSRKSITSDWNVYADNIFEGKWISSQQYNNNRTTVSSYSNTRHTCNTVQGDWIISLYIPTIQTLNPTTAFLNYKTGEYIYTSNNVLFYNTEGELMSNPFPDYVVIHENSIGELYLPDRSRIYKVEIEWEEDKPVGVGIYEEPLTFIYNVSTNYNYMYDDKIYKIDSLGSLSYYNTISKTNTMLIDRDNLETTASGTQGGIVGDYIYNLRYHANDQVYERLYDLKSNTYTELALQDYASHSTYFQHKGHLYRLGGHSNGETTRESHQMRLFRKFDPISKVWTELETPPIGNSKQCFFYKDDNELMISSRGIGSGYTSSTSADMTRLYHYGL